MCCFPVLLSECLVVHFMRQTHRVVIGDYRHHFSGYQKMLRLCTLPLQPVVQKAGIVNCWEYLWR